MNRGINSANCSIVYFKNKAYGVRFEIGQKFIKVNAVGEIKKIE